MGLWTLELMLGQVKALGAGEMEGMYFAHEKDMNFPGVEGGGRLVCDGLNVSSKN